jgi:RNA polymerase sigma-70 factor (ECF subfamily)
MEQTEKPHNDRIDDDRFLRLLRIHQDSLYAFIYTLVHNDTDAEDIMQETSTIMWRKFDTYQDGTSFVAWGIAIAKNLVLRFYDTHRKSNRLFSPELHHRLIDIVSRAIPQQDDRVQHLRDCLKKLNPREHTLIQKRYFHRVSAAALAQESGVAPRAMYRLLTRIHETLLSCIRKAMVRQEGVQ